MSIFDLTPEEPDVLNEEELEDEEFEGTPEDFEEPYDEEYDEDGVAEDEGDVYKDDDGDTEPEENPVVPIRYVDKDGKTFEKEIPYSELSQIVYDAENRRALDKEVDTFVQNTVPLVNEVNNSQVLQHVLYYRSQGYTEDQIKEGLVKLWGQELEGKKKSYNSYDEEIRDTTMKEVEQRLKPVEKKMLEFERQKQVSAAIAHNNAVLATVMNKYNLTDKEVTKDQYREMTAKLAKLNPGKELTQIFLDEDVADMLIVSTIRPNMQPGKKGNAAKKITNLAKIPKVLPGKSSVRQNGQKRVTPIHEDRPTTLEERISNKKDMFS